MKKIFLFFCMGLIAHCAEGQYAITTIAGTGSSGSGGDGGPATAATFSHSNGVVKDAAGNMYVADVGRNAIRKINTSGTITLFAGSASGAAGYSGDGGQATDATFFYPAGLSISPDGNLVISDEGNNAVRQIDLSSGVISTIAGTTGSGYSGDGGQATDAHLNGPASVVYDASGNMYIADFFNNVIRKVSASGIISTYAGNGGAYHSGDGGQATDASIYWPNALAFHPTTGELYICDYGNSVIRKVSASGVISHVAGIANVSGYSGDGGSALTAKFWWPNGIAFNSSGSLFITDYHNERIREITGGIIKTAAGTGTAGHSGDGGPSLSATMNDPAGIFIDASDKIYIAEYSGNVIRKLAPMPVFTNGASQSISVCTNWVTSAISPYLRVSHLDAGASLTWSVVSAPVHGTAVAAYSASSTGGIVTPAGLSYTPTSGFTGFDAFIVQVTDGTYTATTAITVTVNSLPAMPSVTGTTSICVGSSTTLSGTPSGGSWNSGAGSVFTYTAGTVTGAHGGSGVINYRVYNAAGCWNQAATTINVLVPGAIAGFSGGSAVSNICPGGTFTLVHPTAGGTWSSTNNAIATVSGGMVTAVASGRDTIYYTITNACGSVAARWPFTVTGAPAVAGISGYSVPFCTGATRMLADVTSGGSWTTSSGSVATVSASGSLYGVAPGVAIISYSVTNSCGITGTATRMVSVLALPDAGTISGPTSVVNGSTITLSTSGSGGTWSSFAPAIATVNSGGLVRGRSVGSDMIYYTVNNYCGTAVASYSIDVTASRGAAENGNGTVLNENAGIKLYPNPTSNVVNLELIGGASHGNLTITDISGKSIYSSVLTQEKNSIDMSFLPSGVYIFNVSTENGNYTNKVVVE